MSTNECAAAELVERHYETLKTIARAKRQRLPSSAMMMTTDLLHESWIRLGNQSKWNDEAHFIRSVALAMRYVLVDRARAQLSAKRGGGRQAIPLEEVADSLPEYREGPEDILRIEQLMKRLGELNPRYTEVVTLRYFAGFTEVETARILEISDRTVRRDWIAARAWLAAHMSEV